ncbi:MAG: hypothetical protein V7733_13850 [Paraglaciecola polaris]|uniref:hypothetical protein n=1 Tax=Paraglaciecola polaris TaxID=222814 RepID=UPI0030037020
MQMIRKEYYKLDDLSRYFNITLNDIQYWVEKRLIPLRFHRTSSIFAVGDPNDLNYFHGHAYVLYDGLVELLPTHDTELIEDGYTIANTLFLCDRENVETINTECPTVMSPPNQYFKSWLPKEADEIACDFFWAMENHDIKNIGNKTTQDTDGGFVIQHPSDELYRHIEVKYVRYDLEKICITENTLMKLGVLPEQNLTTYKLSVNNEQNAPHETQLTEKVRPATQFTFKNKFHELLARILLENRTLKPKQIHRILSDECKLREDDRVYDIDNILLDSVEGVIVWKDVLASQPEKTCQMGTLRNSLTEVKKILSSIVDM